MVYLVQIQKRTFDIEEGKEISSEQMHKALNATLVNSKWIIQILRSYMTSLLSVGCDWNFLAFKGNFLGSGKLLACWTSKINS